MKAGEAFTLTEAWWKAGKPGVLTDTGLSGALRTFDLENRRFQERDKAHVGPQGDTATAFVRVMNALEEVNRKRLATIEKCGSNPVLKDTKAALLKGGVIDQRKSLYRQIIQQAIRSTVAEWRARLQVQLTRLAQWEHAGQAFIREIEAAQQAGHEDQVKALTAKLSSLLETVQTGDTMSYFDYANNLLVVLGKHPDLAQYIAEVKAVKMESKLNKDKKTQVRMLIEGAL